MGIRITKSVFTLDFRYYDTDLNKGDCKAFTSDNTARFTNSVTAINPGGFGSSWCGSSFVVVGKFDLTAMANLNKSTSKRYRAAAHRGLPPFFF